MLHRTLKTHGVLSVRCSDLLSAPFPARSDEFPTENGGIYVPKQLTATKCGHGPNATETGEIAQRKHDFIRRIANFSGFFLFLRD